MIRRNTVRRLPTQLSDLLAAGAPNSRIALFLDFDGTLVGIRDRPEQAVLPTSLRSLITAISKIPRCIVAIISGRPVSSLQSLIAIPNVHLAGNHGMFIEGPGYRYVHPGIEPAKPALNAVRARLSAAAETMPGVWIETKPASCALHYRLAAPNVARHARTLFLQVVREEGTKYSLRVIRGKKVLEVLPDIAWDKGKAVLWLLRKLDGTRYPIYIGDDRTDEDAFRVLSRIGLTIRVGRSSGTDASYFIRSQDAVTGVLTGILEFLRREQSRT